MHTAVESLIPTFSGTQGRHSSDEDDIQPPPSKKCKVQGGENVIDECSLLNMNTVSVRYRESKRDRGRKKERGERETR